MAVGVTLEAGPAWGRRPAPGNEGAFNYPGAPHIVPDTPASPYAMNYVEEAVRTLGFKNGRMDFFSIRPQAGDPLWPTLTGGVDKNGAMLKLKWRPGQ